MHRCGSISRGNELRNPDTTVWIKDSSEALWLVLAIRLRREGGCDLSENTDGVDRIDICDCVCICIFILEQEGPKVRLTALHHLFDRRYDCRIANDYGFVEAWEKRPPRDG